MIQYYTYQRTGKVICMDTNPDNSLLAIAGANNIKILGLNPDRYNSKKYVFGQQKSYKPRSKSKKPFNCAKAMEWNKLDPTLIAVSSNNGQLLIGHIQRNQSIRCYFQSIQSPNTVVTLSWQTQNKNILAIGTNQNGISILDMRQPKKKSEFKTTQQQVRTISFNPKNKNLLAISYQNGWIKLADMRTLGIIMSKVASGDSCTIDWNPQYQSRIASASKSGQIKIWDIGSQKFQMQQKFFHIRGIQMLRWNKKRRMSLGLISIDQINNQVYFYSLSQTNRPYAIIKGEDSKPNSFLLDQKQQLIIVGYNNGQVIVQNFNNQYDFYQNCPKNPMIFGHQNQIYLNFQSKKSQVVDGLDSKPISYSQDSICTQHHQQIHIFPDNLYYPSKTQFMYLSENYKKSNNFRSDCEYNAQICRKYSKYEIGELWQNIILLVQQIEQIEDKEQRLNLGQLVDYFNKQQTCQQDKMMNCIKSQQIKIDDHQNLIISKSLSKTIKQFYIQQKKKQTSTIHLQKQKMLFNILQQAVDQGQLQSVVQIMLAISQYKKIFYFNLFQQSFNWFYDLIELARKFQMYKYAIKLYHRAIDLKGIQSIQDKKYGFKVGCSKCRLQSINGLCRRCKQIKVCNICCKRLDNLIFYCQKCSNSYHMQHIKNKCPNCKT